MIPTGHSYYYSTDYPVLPLSLPASHSSGHYIWLIVITSIIFFGSFDGWSEFKTLLKSNWNSMVQSFSGDKREILIRLRGKISRPESVVLKIGYLAMYISIYQRNWCCCRGILIVAWSINTTLPQKINYYLHDPRVNENDFNIPDSLFEIILVSDDWQFW